MPPLHLIGDMLLQTVLPAALTAIVVMALVERFVGPKQAPLGSALALAAGMAVGVWWRELPALIPGESTWNRLPWAALAAMALGLLRRLALGDRRAGRVGHAVVTAAGWVACGGTAVGVAAWVIPTENVRLLTGIFAAVVLSQWLLLERLASRPPGGTIVLALALCFFAAAGVLIYAAIGSYMDRAVILAAALGGIALVAWWRRLDAGGAVPGAAVLLCGLLLLGQQQTSSDLPATAFALPAVAPLMLALTLPLRTGRGARLRLVRLALVLLPLAAALAIAMQSGPLEFGDEQNEWGAANPRRANCTGGRPYAVGRTFLSVRSDRNVRPTAQVSGST